jgi:hypothetical protein
VTLADTASCRATFATVEDNSRHRARLIDEAFPGCACECCSISEGSPGKVSDVEEMYRFFVSPVDVDARTNLILATAFEKAAQSGLSLFRGCASDDDIKRLVQDRLTVKAGKPHLTVLGLLKAVVLEVRGVEGAVGGRSFCVYDETVPRKLDKSLPHVPTHVSIYQRMPPPGGEGRNKKIESDNYKLYSLLVAQRIDVAEFRGGLLLELNKRSLAGKFVLPIES